MAWFRSSYLNAMNPKDLDRTGPGTADANLIKSIWNLNPPKAEPEKAPRDISTDIYSTRSHSSVPSRRKRKQRRS